LNIYSSSGWSEDTFLPLSSNRSIEYEELNPFGDPFEPIFDLAGAILSIEIRYMDGSNTTRNPIISLIDGANIAERGSNYIIDLQAY